MGSFWEKKAEKRRRPFCSERRKTAQRSGLGRAAGLAYDPRGWAAGVWTLEKRRARLAPKGIRRPAKWPWPRSWAGLRPEGLGAVHPTY